MPDRHLHIISFDVPYPPDYGGVIDVFHKIRTLHSMGIRIILHCFEYGRKEMAPLHDLCEKVYCYPRLTGIRSAIGWRPYIVESRRSADLIKNLLGDQHPILFEGLHACYYLNDPRLAGRFKIYRESNLEHRYYFHLAKAEKQWWKKIFFMMSGLKLLFYQPVIRHANLVLTVSDTDRKYLLKKFPRTPIVNIPSFHSSDAVTSPIGKGDYLLYHGNLAVPENEKAAIYLVEKVLNKISFPVIIAGRNPSDRLVRTAAQYSHIRVISNPTEPVMTLLIRQAHAHLLVTFQATGLKLKLLNALFNGRYCIVNHNMLAGTDLEELCLVSDHPEGIMEHIKAIIGKAFDETALENRKTMLLDRYGNRNHAALLIELIDHMAINSP